MGCTLATKTSSRMPAPSQSHSLVGNCDASLSPARAPGTTADGGHDDDAPQESAGIDDRPLAGSRNEPHHDNARCSTDDPGHTTSRCRPLCGIGRRPNDGCPGGDPSTNPPRAWTWKPTGGILTPLGPCSRPPAAGDSCRGYVPPPVSTPILPPHTARHLPPRTRATMMLSFDSPLKVRLQSQCAALFNRR